MRPTRLRRRRGLAAALIAVGLLQACTGDDAQPGSEPSPEPSASAPANDRAFALDLPDVAVVLPARNARPEAEIEVQRDLVTEVAVAARAAGQVDEVRIVVPDRFSTVGDVLTVLAEEGYDLVCALGPGAARGLREVAARFPETRFCATPGRLPEVGANSLVFDLRVEEAAYLAGIAARFAATASTGTAGRSPAPALVFGDASQPPRLVGPFEEGFLAARPDAPTTTALVAADPDAARAAAASQFAGGAFLVYTSAGRPEVAVVDAAIEADGLVIGWEAWLGPLVPAQQPQAQEPSGAPTPEPPAGDGTDGTDGTGEPVVATAPWNLMLFRENLATALRDAITELATGWTGGSRSLGFSNGALQVVPGTSPTWERVRSQVLSTQDAIIRGDIVVAAG